MKRWSLMPLKGMALWCCAAALTSPLTSLTAQAQPAEASAPEPRKFPPGALRAVMVVLAPPEVLINGQPGRLAPGARIRNVQNLDVLSGSLVNQSVVVNYTRDNLGQVREVWLLSNTEAAEKRPTTPPVQNEVPLRYDQLPAFK